MASGNAKRSLMLAIEEIAQDERKLIIITDESRMRARMLEDAAKELESSRLKRLATRLKDEAESADRLRLRLAGIRKDVEDVMQVF